jgi:hypothetical protein
MFASALLLDQIEVMRELYGDDALTRTMAALDREVQHELGELTSGGWVRVSTSAALKKELARHVGDGPLNLQRRVVARATERTFRGIWRFFLPRLSDSWLLKFSPMVYAKTFDCGALSVERIDPGRAEVLLRGWPGIPDFDCVGIAAGIETVLALARRERPKLAWVRRDDGAVRFTGTWVHKTR